MNNLYELYYITLEKIDVRIDEIIMIEDISSDLSDKNTPNSIIYLSNKEIVRTLTTKKTITNQINEKITKLAG